MPEILRSTTFQLEFKGQDGITGIRQFTRAVSDADEIVEELSKTLGDNTEVTFKNVQSKKELVADGRRLVAQIERTKGKVSELTRMYEHQSKAVNRTADEQEVLNAVYKLGAHATEKQKQEVTKLVQNYQQVRKETTKTQGSFRNLRGVSQNLGWQLQDVAVQAQMGTSAFIIFSQQGSQMASSFGPAGALIGALIAVSGALLGVAFSSDKAKEAAKNLKETEFELLPVLREKAKALKFLEAAQLRYLKSQDEKQLKKMNLELKGLDATIFSSGNQWNLTGKKLKEHNEELERTRAKQETVVQSIAEIEERMEGYNNDLKENAKKHRELRDSLEEFVLALEQEAKNLRLSDRSIAINTAIKKGALDFDILRINAAYDLIEAEAIRLKQEKESAKQSATIIRLFEAESKAVIKQTESIEQEYARRRETIDQYVTFIGNSTEETKATYKNLEIWRTTQLDKEFKVLSKSLIKQTNTVEQEFNKRKAVIDGHVARVGFIDSEAALSYAALEMWKTEQLTKEYDKRESVRKQIEKGQIDQFKRADPTGGETDLFAANLLKLSEQKKTLGENELAERQRIDALIEDEVLRHTARLDEISNTQLIGQLMNFATFTGAMGQVFGQLSAMAEEGSKEAAALFYINQAIALADTIVNTELAATKAMGQLGVFGIPAATIIRATGYASAGIIAGQTIAGAFDQGGNIPNGQIGIVSEFGDELVNGQLIKGPARVTSREDTAKLMNGGGGLTKIIIENKIEGARFTEQRVDESTVKIIAEQVFSDNIDSGVSGVLNNRNSKSTKTMKSKFSVRSQF